MSKFGIVSGVGWLLDFALLFLLVRFLQLPVFKANLISATTAALTVFALSRKLAFNAKNDRVFLRLLFYFVYTLVIIVVASAAMKYVAWKTGAVASAMHHLLQPSTRAMVAKVLVTPLNFLLNFLMAKLASEHGKATS